MQTFWRTSSSEEILIRVSRVVFSFVYICVSFICALAAVNREMQAQSVNLFGVISTETRDN